MATVKKDITEVSDKIIKVKKIVKKRAERLKEKELLQTPVSEGVSWKDLKIFLIPKGLYVLVLSLVVLELSNTLFKGLG